MTISSASRKAGPFLGNGVTTSFPFTFKVFTTSDVQLIKTSVAGVDAPLVLNSDYSVALNADQNASPGGTITYPLAGNILASGEKLTATGVLSALQNTHITNGGNFFANNIEDQMDYLTILVQQHEEKLSRVALASSSDINPILSIGTAVQRALTYPAFDANGNLSLSQSLPSGTLSNASIVSFLGGDPIGRQTPQETAATVTPIILVPTLQIDLERYGGGVGASATTNFTAWQSAMKVIVKKGGGTLVMRGGSAGNQYNFGANTLTAAQGLILQADGYNTVFKFATTGTNAGLLIPSTAGGRTELRDLVLSGPGDGITGSGNAGWGLQLGDSAGNTGFVVGRKVNMNGWATALVMGGCIWARFEQCEFGPAVGNSGGNISNNVGIDFNFQKSGNQVNAVTFQDCVISNNATNGVKATNVSAAMNAINWYATTVQSNCQNATGNAQFQPGSMQGFSIKGLYMEYVFGGTLPDAVDSTLWSYGSLRDFYIIQCAQGIRDRAGGSMGQVSISDGAVLFNTGNPINCASEQDLKIENVFSNTGTVIATNANGSKAYLPSGAGIGGWKVDESTFAGILTAASGTITQSAVCTYSQVGNVVSWTASISWSSIAGASGQVTLTGLPVASKAGSQITAVSVGAFNGITVPAQSQLTGQIAAGGTTAILLFSQASFANLTVAAFASAGQIVLSGQYQV